MLSIAPLIFCTLFRNLPPITSKYTYLLMNSAQAAPTLRRSKRIAFLTKSSRFYSSDRPVTVEHDSRSGRFFIDIEGFERAYLEYERKGNRIKITNTQVPNALQGRGLGKKLAKTALEYVAQNDFQMKVECEFVQDFINNYEPRYMKYLSE